MWFRRYPVAQRDRQTDRHTDTLITILRNRFRGRSNHSILHIIMPSVCLCATEVRALYGLRLPAPEVGGARSLHATQLGATVACYY